MEEEIKQEQEEKKIVDSVFLDEVLIQQQAKFLENQGLPKQTVAGHQMQAPNEKKIFDSADHFKTLAEQDRLREQLDFEAREKLRTMHEANSKSASNTGMRVPNTKLHVNLEFYRSGTLAIIILHLA